MTIKDLAAKTGYAVATVSRVLNNHPNVSEKARTVIMQEVEESGFQLNVNAKRLKQQHATSILVVVLAIGWRLGGPVGVGTLIAAIFQGPIMQFAFHTMKFDATSVHHQHLVDSIRVITGKGE